MRAFCVLALVALISAASAQLWNDYEVVANSDLSLAQGPGATGPGPLPPLYSNEVIGAPRPSIDPAQDRRHPNQIERGTDPRGTDPRGYDPRRTDPRGTDSRGTDPRGTDLRGNDPRGTDPRRTDPRGTDPRGTDPRGTDPRRTDPRRTDPRGTDIRRTDPRGTDPRRTDPRGTDPRGTDPRGTDPRGTDPRGTDPRGTDPRGYDPRRTDPRGTDTRGYDPRRTDPRGTDPRGTDPRGTDTKGTDPRGTDPRRHPSQNAASDVGRVHPNAIAHPTNPNVRRRPKGERRRKQNGERRKNTNAEGRRVPNEVARRDPNTRRKGPRQPSLNEVLREDPRAPGEISRRRPGGRKNRLDPAMGNATRTRYSCPVQFVRHGSSCYFLSTNMASWQEAHFECRDRKSELARMEQRWEDRNMRAYLSKPELAPLERWIGGIYNWEQKQWVWGATANVLGYQGFSRRKAHADHRWQCIAMDPTLLFRWTPRGCLEERHFLCETPLVETTNRV